MLVFNSQLMEHGIRGWPAWKVLKLPIAHGAQLATGREATTVDEVWEQQCARCLGTAHLEPTTNEEVEGPPIEWEQGQMEAEDKNILLLCIERARDAVFWQVQQGTTAGQLLAQYAQVKRVRRSSLKLFDNMKEDEVLVEDSELYLRTGPAKKLRGGHCLRPLRAYDTTLILLHDGILGLSYLTEADGTPALENLELPEGAVLWYKGSQISEHVVLTDLRDTAFSCIPHRCASSSVLRTPEQIQNWVTLGEICEWYGPPSYISLDDITYRAWMLDTIERWLRGNDQLRAGARGKLAWESTQTVKGVQLVTQLKAENKTLEEIPVNGICSDASGVSCCLMSSWPRVASVRSTKALILCMPGRCAMALRKLGVKEGDIDETEAFLKEPETGEVLKRRVTFVKLFDGNYTVGENVQTIDWAPQASVELLIELDSRWSPAPTLARAQRDWRGLAAEVASKMALTNVPINEIYAHKMLQQDPFQVWQCRVRLSAEVAEKLICASGQESCFVRPVLAKSLANNEQFTIVWMKRNTEAGLTALAEMLKLLTSLPGNRGLARSQTSVGARVRWDNIKEARSILTPHDPRFTESTLGMHDGLTFKMEGIPAAATSEEVARFCRDINWPAVPRRRVPFRGQTTWWTTAAKAPERAYASWAGNCILISQVSEEEKYRPKTQENKSKQKKELDKVVGETTSATKASSSMGSKDALLERDPWASYTPASGMAASTSTMVQVPTDNDHKMCVLTQRLDRMEQAHAQLNERVDKVDTTVQTLSSSMKEQFQKVLAGIANLSSLQEQDRAAAKKQRTEGS